ncbi:MAG: hypothetical protein E6Q67_04910 [Roseateles sp.]|nr:MAG: hypothetical protein E6Q67_04910 [Roseateles sp.]
MLRRRHLILFGAVTMVALAYLTDPGHGAETSVMLMSVAIGLVAVLFAHWGRKWLHDYPEADMRKLFAMAGRSPVGAGLALVALAIVSSALLGLFGRNAHAAAIPAQAEALLPVLHREIKAAWPAHPWPAYYGGLIEHETGPCPGRQCWRPTARLKSAREEGAGLAQITRTWDADGKPRFDVLAELRDAFPAALGELSWLTIYERPELQMRAMVIKSRTDWRWMRSWARIEFMDLAWNAGRGRVSQDRRACGLKPGCDPAQWFGHVETTCTASRVALYGRRSACDISRHHVADVMARATKYDGKL